MIDEKIARLMTLNKEMEKNREKMEKLIQEEFWGSRGSYNKKIRFDGDIIITDPCYIINKKNDERFGKNGKLNFPCWWDFVSKTTTTECDNGKGGTYTRYNMPNPEDYPDCRKKTKEDSKLSIDYTISKESRLNGFFSPTLHAEWEAYYKARDEWDSVPHDDWSRCNCGEDMSVLGLKNYLTGDTIYGDWSCSTFTSNMKKIIGEFCADSGMVGVFLLDEVLAYNPDFNYHINKPWTTTLIKDFHGTVELKLTSDDEVQVIGEGNIDFVSVQTGF